MKYSGRQTIRESELMERNNESGSELLESKWDEREREKFRQRGGTVIDLLGEKKRGLSETRQTQEHRRRKSCCG